MSEYFEEGLKKGIEKIAFECLSKEERISIGRLRKVINNYFLLYEIPIIIRNRKPKGLEEFPELPHFTVYSAIKSSDKFYVKSLYKILGIDKNFLTPGIRQIINSVAREYFGYNVKITENIIYEKNSEKIQIDRKELRREIKKEIEREIKNFERLIEMLNE